MSEEYTNNPNYQTFLKWFEDRGIIIDVNYQSIWFMDKTDLTNRYMIHKYEKVLFSKESINDFLQRKGLFLMKTGNLFSIGTLGKPAEYLFVPEELEFKVYVKMSENTYKRVLINHRVTKEKFKERRSSW